MSARELIVLGTASQVPTRRRNHNGYLLRWDGEGILFDPGEGTQRQMLRAGVSAHAITRICLTHFHGDHCLGLAGVVQRLNLDRVPHPVTAHYPASGQRYFERLRYASAFHETVELIEAPAQTDGALDTLDGVFTLEARRLSHSLECFGYRISEPDSRRMLPDRLAGYGIVGPAIGMLQRHGVITAPDGATVTLDQVSEPRKGQSFAFVMDTRICDAVVALADGVDLLVIESTYLNEDARLAEEHGHLTVGQAAEAASTARVRHLVLTHFSQRYADPGAFLSQARERFDGEITIAEDLSRIPLPRRSG